MHACTGSRFYSLTWLFCTAAAEMSRLDIHNRRFSGVYAGEAARFYARALIYTDDTIYIRPGQVCMSRIELSRGFHYSAGMRLKGI